MSKIVKFVENEIGQPQRTWYSYASDQSEMNELIRMNTTNYMVTSTFRGEDTKYMKYHNSKHISTTHRFIDEDSFFSKKDHFKLLDLASQIKLSMPKNIKDLQKFT